MTSDLARVIYDDLSRRCAELGVALWHCDPTGIVVTEPPSPQIGKAQIEQAAQAMCRNKPAPVEIVPGQWLVPIEDAQSGHRDALNLALVPTENLKNISLMLRWSYEEISRAHRDGQTIEQFSEKLAQAYEETNLLYRMARLLNHVGDAAESVETIVTQLQQVLPFAWLAIRFNMQAAGVRELNGKTIIAGKLPCDVQLLKQLTDLQLDRRHDNSSPQLLEPQRDPLAAATGAQVLTQPICHSGRVIGMLIAGNKTGSDPQLNSFEMQFVSATADFIGVFHENISRFGEQQELFLGTLRALSASIDAKDRYTRGHSERVGLMAAKMAEALKYDKQTIEQYRIAGLVHDVGKIGVPEAVLAKPSRLTDEEFEMIKRHPEIGHDILKDIPAMRPILPGVLWHHERWDGRGYPHNIAGEDIPMLARVLALADTFDAMSSTRAYRPALPRAKVLEEIQRSAGSQFDPVLAPLFVSLDFTDFDLALRTHVAMAQQAA
ncbi:MAG TPA: HD-GYP domain-containing protein [Tepidisphaeraceae bacterium]|nr:HD-GYP domain-containing protein [Tepidisphaeraceae bacterium]